MRSRLALAALWTLLVVSPCASRADDAVPDRIGRLRIEQTPAGVVVAAPSGGEVARVVIGVGLGFAALGALRRRRAIALLGLAVAGVGGAAVLFGGTTWTAGPDGLRERTRLSGERFVPRADIERIAVGQRPTAPDSKESPRPLRFEVRVYARGSDTSTARIALETREQADALARLLAEALGVPRR